MTNPTLTPEQLLKCAQIVEPECKWRFYEKFKANDVPYCKKAYTFYSPLNDGDKSIRQQLRIRKHLAKRGVVTIEIDGRTYAMKTGYVTWTSSQAAFKAGDTIAVHKDDDICAVLAVIALGDQ